LAAGFLGIGVASITILYAVAPGERLQQLHQMVGKQLARLFSTSIFSVAVCSVFFTLAIPVDSSSKENWVPSVAIGTAVLLLANVARLLWILHRVISAIADDVAGASLTPPGKRSEYVAPQIQDDDYPVEARKIQ
jgi:hypothetical protein